MIGKKYIQEIKEVDIFYRKSFRMDPEALSNMGVETRQTQPSVKFSTTIEQNCQRSLKPHILCVSAST